MAMGSSGWHLQCFPSSRSVGPTDAPSPKISRSCGRALLWVKTAPAVRRGLGSVHPVSARHIVQGVLRPRLPGVWRVTFLLGPRSCCVLDRSSWEVQGVSPTVTCWERYRLRAGIVPACSSPSGSGGQVPGRVLPAGSDGGLAPHGFASGAPTGNGSVLPPFSPAVW